MTEKDRLYAPKTIKDHGTLENFYKLIKMARDKSGTGKQKLFIDDMEEKADTYGESMKISDKQLSYLRAIARDEAKS